MYGTPKTMATRGQSDGATEAGQGRCLLVERPAIPWTDADEAWSAADRAEYERARGGAKAVVLLDGESGRASVRVPAVLRESLLSMWGDPDDAELRRELGRLAGDEAVPDED